jgi:hypothetical protein
MTVDEIAEMRAMVAMLDYLKPSHPHGPRLTPRTSSSQPNWSGSAIGGYKLRP